MLLSPRPIAPADPAPSSAKRPAPTRGESPTRPGIFHASPLVDVQPPTRPLPSKHETWTVPSGGVLTAGLVAPPSLSSSQLSRSARFARHSSHFLRDEGVRRSV